MKFSTSIAVVFVLFANFIGLLNACLIFHATMDGRDQEAGLIGGYLMDGTGRMLCRIDRKDDVDPLPFMCLEGMSALLSKDLKTFSYATNNQNYRMDVQTRYVMEPGPNVLQLLSFTYECNNWYVFQFKSTLMGFG